jgi:MerR family transcriptional regulator, thiopeptide resistance regulator
MLTISALARRHGLSRSTLLYYDRIGLLRPTGRSAAGYRLYTETDERRLAAICLYRQADVPLDTVARLLDGGNAVQAALSAHLAELGRRIQTLKDQQVRVLRLLGSVERPASPLITAADLTRTLSAAGFDDDGLDRLHAVFERTDPEAHRAFLEALGLEPAAVETVRERARNTGIG